MKALNPEVTAQAVEFLNRIFSGRYHSLAQYILEAGAYESPSQQGVARAVSEIADYDRKEAERLADIIEDLDAVPQVGPYPHEFAELNYLSLDYMERFLETELRKQLDDYQAGMAKADPIPAAQTAAMDVCRELRRHLELLRNAMTVSTQPASQVGKVDRVDTVNEVDMAH